MKRTALGEVKGARVSLAISEMGAGGLGAAQQARGYASAERNYEEALRIANKLEDGEPVASLAGNQAELALDRNDWPEAERIELAALTYSKKMGRQELIVADRRRFAGPPVRQSRKGEGLRYARRVVEIYLPLRLPDLAAPQAAL